MKASAPHRPQQQTIELIAPPARPPRDRRRPYRWTNRLALFAATAMLGVAAVIFTLPPEITTRVRGQTLHSRDRAALLSLLADLKVTWNPEDQQRIVERAAAKLPGIELAFHWILAQPAHRYVEQAIDLAGALHLASTRDDLLQLMARRELRARASLAADLIEPLAPEQLDELFDARDLELRQCAVQIAARHEPPPIAQLLRLLRDPDRPLRAQATAALPAAIPPEFAPQLQSLAADSDPTVAVFGLQALAHVPFSAEIEQLLVDASGRTEDPVVAAALATLGAKGAPLGKAAQDRLWDLAERAPARVCRAGAFLALEQTGSTTPDQVRGRLPQQDDLGTYFAARLLLSAGAADGIDRLFSLVESTTDAVDMDARAVRFAALALLGSLSGMPASSLVDDLRQHFAAQPIESPQSLPAPQLAL